MNIQAKPTRYSGVEFKSRLEARFAEMLDKQRISWNYEPANFVFGNYQPDFYLPYVGTHGLFVEIKPREFLPELEIFWEAIWTANAAWICVDKADAWRGGWVMLQANSRFRGSLRFHPSPVPIVFRREGPVQHAELSAFQIIFTE